jgi:hypothetical protein
LCSSKYLTGHDLIKFHALLRIFLVVAIYAWKYVLTHLQGSEMDNAVDIGVRSEDLVKRGFISDIDVVICRSSSCQQFNAANDFLGGIVLIVNNDNLIACLDESYCGEGANIARSTVVESENVRVVEDFDAGVCTKFS